MGNNKIKLKDWALETIGTLNLWLLTVTLGRNFLGGCKVLESSFYLLVKISGIKLHGQVKIE